MKYRSHQQRYILTSIIGSQGTNIPGVTFIQQIHWRSNTSRSVISRYPVYRESSVDPKFTMTIKKKISKCIFYLIWKKKKKKMTNSLRYWFFAHIQTRNRVTHYDQTIQLVSISTQIDNNWQSIHINRRTCHNQCHNWVHVLSAQSINDKKRVALWCCLSVLNTQFVALPLYTFPASNNLTNKNK